MSGLNKYFRCNSCGQIELEHSWTKSNDQQICPHCKAISKESWPTSEVAELLGFVLDYDKLQPRYTQVVSVFISSAFELMLEELITMMMYWNLSYEEGSMLVDALLDSHQGRARMLWLYKRMGHSSFSDEAKQIGHPDFARNWDRLTSIRNMIVHGKFKEAELIQPEFAATIIGDSLEVFRILYNQYIRETVMYEHAMLTPEQKDADDDFSRRLEELL